MLIDSSVYAAGTVDHMLNGKEFNRATRTLAYEALGVSWLSAFFSWCNENDLIKSFSDIFGQIYLNLLSYFHQNQVPMRLEM